MATIIIFALSLGLCVILVVFKAFEVRYGKANPIAAGLSKLDPKSDKFIATLKFRCLQIIQSVRYIILVQTKEYLHDLLTQLEEKISAEYQKRHETMMGRRQFLNHGTASFYLKKITEHKGAGERGKIEESL